MLSNKIHILKVIFLRTDTDEDETESAYLPSEDQDWQDPGTTDTSDTGTGYSSVSQVFDKVRQGEEVEGEGEPTQLSLVQTLLSSLYLPASVHTCSISGWRLAGAEAGGPGVHGDHAAAAGRLPGPGAHHALGQSHQVGQL